MSLAFALKLLTDMCYFMFAISSITTKFAHSGMLVTGPLLMAFASGLAAFAAEKRPRKPWLRFVALAPAIGAFFFTDTGADWFVTIVMLCYLAFVVWKNNLSVNYDDTQSRFITCIKLIPIIIIVTIVGSNKDGFIEVMLPYFFMFLVLNIMLLRMLRHSEQVFADKKFRILNATEIALVCGLGLLLSTGYFITVFKFIGNLIMNYILRPFFTLIMYVIGGIMWVFRKIFGGIDLNLDEIDLSELEQQMNETMSPGDMAVMEYYAEETAKQDYRVLTYVIIGVGSVILIILIFFLMRMLMRAGRRAETNHFGDFREAIDDEGHNNDKLTRSPRDRVRSCYRKFLKLCLHAGLDPDVNVNSREINYAMRNTFDRPAMDGLRSVYIRARYSSADITDDDVKTAKQMLDMTRKAEKAEAKRKAREDRSTGA